VATRNRAESILQCLDSIAVAFDQAAPLNAEIVVVDNGSSDGTLELVGSWVAASRVPVKLLHEARPGHARAQNVALQAARGELLKFTDDDCRLDPQFVNDLVRHDREDQSLVLRGGRIELGDSADLPLTISTGGARVRWVRGTSFARHNRIGGACMVATWR
jgi:glycosyltransferase involved in cell wall biosynthesis